jgi:hypothetical protein
MCSLVLIDIKNRVEIMCCDQDKLYYVFYKLIFAKYALELVIFQIKVPFWLK